MKKILARFVKVIAFALIFALLLQIFSHFYEPKNNSDEAGIIDFRANGILSERENSIDVLVLGDSEAYCGFVPLKLWRDYGYTSYICGSSGQVISYSDEFLRSAFETQRPKIVILEAHTALIPYGFANRIANYAERKIPLFRYHNRWKTASPAEMLEKVEYDTVIEDKGYYFSEEIEGCEPGDYMADTGSRSSVAKRNSDYIAKMRDFCRENGADFVLVSVPSSVNWSYANHCAVSDMAEALQVDYLDMNLLNDEIQIDWARDTLDGGDHLNIYGASKTTGYLGEYLKSSFALEDKRADTEYSEWNGLCEKYG